jgi:hypothetical protein
MLTVFLNASGANGFTKWSIARPPNANDDDEPGGATPMAIAVPALDDEPIIAVPEQPDRLRARVAMPRVGHCPEQTAAGQAAGWPEFLTLGVRRA